MMVLTCQLSPLCCALCSILRVKLRLIQVGDDILGNIFEIRL